MKYTSAVLEFFSAVVLLILIISCLMEKNKSKQSRAFLALAGANELSLVFEAVSLAFYGLKGVDQLLVVLNVMAYISGFILAFCFVLYVYCCIEQAGQISTIWLRVSGILCMISTILLLVGCRFRWFFRVEDGLFHMTPYFIISLSYDIIGVLIAMCMIVVYRKHLSSRDIMALLTFPMLAIAAIVIQYLVVQKASLIFVLTMISCMIIYLMIQFDRMRRYYIQEQQMKEMYTQLMLSQIQPHFIFNSLSSIRRLIKKDAETAVKAVENFSLYLRKNLDSLNFMQPVPFQRELEHTMEYLYLEQLRFGERLRVEYNIKCTEFTIPVLTLQPLVENAAKHGILEKVAGGTIYISTEETDKYYIITIQDDGIGFDTNAVPSDGHTHIGIPNVRFRLKNQCKGELYITSRVGSGTLVQIQIPKGA